MKEPDGTSLRGDISLRAVDPSDEEFLYGLFRELRSGDFEGLGLDSTQLDGLLRLQYTAQKRSYEAQFGESGHRIILIDGRRAGRFWTASDDSEIQLVDIVVEGEQRGRGVARFLIEELQREAARAGKPVRLQVAIGNRAAILYERLGFVTTGESGPYRFMEWRQS